MLPSGVLDVTPDPSPSEESLRLLRRAVSRGEALLFLGQDHNPGLIDDVLRDARVLLRRDTPWESLPELYAAIGLDHGARTTVASLFARKETDVSLLEVASLPWMAVIASAVDPLVSRAFLNVGSQRRLVELGPTEVSGISAGRAGQILQLIRAFGTTDASGGPLVVPASAEALAEARLLRVPAIATTLPRLLGVHGRVVVTGVTNRDWLNDQALAPLLLVLSSLPSGTVHWFGQAPDAVSRALSGKAIFFPEPFDRFLLESTKNEVFAKDVKSARARVFGIGERIVTLDQWGETLTIRFTASEWRSITAVASMIDDPGIAEFAAQPPATRHDLIGFLRRSHAGVPDWAGPARGLIFERARVRQLIRAAEDFVAKPKASVLDSTGEGRGARRVPFILAGPPASGKTMGLMHAAWVLRTHSRLCVLWLFRRALGPDIVAIERVCRLLEAKGVGWTVLCLDSPDPEEHERLKRRLESEGRRILVLGTESRVERAPEADGQPGLHDVHRFRIGSELLEGEELALREFLRRFDLLPKHSAQSDFLRLLADAIPETQFGAFPSLLEEYERLLEEAKQAVSRSAPTGSPAFGSLAAKLRAALPQLAMGPEQVDIVVSTFESVPLLRDVLAIVLFCSQLDRPIPLDFLLKAFGTELITSYPQFCEAFTKTALVDEIELDEDGLLALTALHQLHALWLLRGLYPDRSEQLSILENLAVSVDWDAKALPGENLYQDFALELLRAIGPRGEYKDLYSSNQALGRLSHILQSLRERSGVEQPKLLTLEAIILGDLAVRETRSDSESATQRCALAIELLERSEELLRIRRPTDARNFELLKTLTLAADLRGTLLNIPLRGSTRVSKATESTVLDELARIESDAVRAQSYSPSYHPLDVAFWAHRDALDRLPALLPAVRTRLLETMASILDIAEEEPLDPTQRQYLRVRKQELMLRIGELAVGEELARAMREEGDFSGELALTRYRRSITQGAGVQPASTAKAELLRLAAFRPRILSHLHAVRLMQSLWVGAFMDGTFGQGAPQMVRAAPSEWRILADVAGGRRQSRDESEHPYALFFLGWALLQLGEGREARETFSSLERQSLGNPRRVGELALVTNEDGSVRLFRARVIHARAGQVRVGIPEVGADVIDLRPQVETELAPAGLRLGEYVSVAIALNYRGLQVRSPNPGTPAGRGGRR